MLLSYCRSTSSSKGQEASCLYLHLPHFFCYMLYIYAGMSFFPVLYAVACIFASLCVCPFSTLLSAAAWSDAFRRVFTEHSC